MKVYRENITRFKAFYQSDFYKFLDEQKSPYIPNIFTTLSEDPDARDIVLYRALKERYDFDDTVTCKPTHLEVRINGKQIRLAADVVCGRKQLVKLHHGDFEAWVKDYERVRGSLNLHFIWPKHKLPTINTLRFTIYLDRIDCLLFDLKQYFLGKETPMNLAYNQEETKLWLSQFSNFPDFIDKMKLNEFVNDGYDVYNIEKGKPHTLEDFMERTEITKSINHYLKMLIKTHSTFQI